MHKRFFTRILAAALCLICAAGLTAPACAASDDLGYQYTFTKEFTFSDFLLDETSGWYAVPLDVLSVSDQVEASQVQFSIDDYSFTSSFKILQRAHVYHYIGNCYDIFGGGAQTDDPYLLVICPDNAASNMLYISPEIFGKLFQGDQEKKHIIMSVVADNPPTVDDLTSVFTFVGDKIMSLLNALISLFWTVNADGIGSITFLGVLSLVSLGVSIVLLLIRVVLNFLHLRG